VPGAPTLDSATLISSGEVDLMWTAPSNDGGSPVTGYGIYRDGVEIAVVGLVWNYPDVGFTSG
jgi:Fibronectin type III domain.